MNGGDGFESFKDPENEYIVDDERGVPLSVLLRNFFWAIETVNDAIKLSQDQDENMNQDQNQKLVEDLNKLMTRLGINNQNDNIVQKETQDENRPNIELLTVEPLLEGRIVDIADKENKDKDNQFLNVNVNVDGNVDESKLILSPNYNKLPSYVNMTHKPKRKQSITAFISNFD